ncbi:hypothetical protein Q4543_17760 [Salipiger sp. 1_MG-2023]|uniref:hypothetical protein n=1 Tax=Salipiger sp. 1_MG-2023 TaxID=3062665 RepID=UPI0026E452D8|nr:hypothetical protein [Salipiger sp. 1_MG-2023]MDO6587362.1 hypothetical protein [Salipiger sp. 1_MG-2023]
MDPLEQFTDSDLTLSGAAALHSMARAGDLHHIDGPLIQALTDLADTGNAEVFGCVIERLPIGMFRVTMGASDFVADSALHAVIEAQTANRTAWLGNTRPGWSTGYGMAAQ